MKAKDLYTKIVLTIIAITLVVHLLKDVDLITKANATSPSVPSLNVNQTANIDRDITFYIYENESLHEGFGFSSLFRDRAKVDPYYDVPKYIITTKTGSFEVRK